jgi:hypothetical protein
MAAARDLYLFFRLIPRTVQFGIRIDHKSCTKNCSHEDDATRRMPHCVSHVVS